MNSNNIELVAFQNLSEPVKVKVITAVATIPSGGGSGGGEGGGTSALSNYIQYNPTLFSNYSQILKGVQRKGLATDWIKLNYSNFGGDVVLGVRTQTRTSKGLCVHDLVEIQLPNNINIEEDNFEKGVWKIITQYANNEDTGAHVFSYIVLPQFDKDNNNYRFKVLILDNSDASLTLSVNSLYTYEINK